MSNFNTMGDNYLYPGDNVKPISVGERYKDYLLSELLRDVVSSGISVSLSYVGIAGLQDCYEWDAVISFFPKVGWDSNRMLSIMIMSDSYYARKLEEDEKAISDLVIRIYENTVSDINEGDSPRKHLVRKITFVRLIY